MKKQADLTIISLMVLLLLAGFAGLLTINALIRHRCPTDPAAHLCVHKSALTRQESYPPFAPITQPSRSEA